jgi:hypothetical protein
MAYTTIDDPSAHFQTALYTGNGSTGQNITNDGNSDLQPDWVWAKRRDADTSHGLVDSSRGVRKVLSSNGTSAEVAESAGNTLTAFLSDGFTVGDDGNYTAFNANGSSIVAWQWKANGGTTSSNSDGSITSTVQANTTAGFSIVTYTGTGSAATIGHGLGAEPDMVIIKSRSNAVEWQVYLKSFGNDDTGLFLDTTDAATSATNYYNNGGTSSVFGVSNNTGVGTNTYTYVAYCFRNIQGYSKIGSYSGAIELLRPFIYTGFKPAWLMIKRTDATTNARWYILDNARNPINPVNKELYANQNDGDADRIAVDFLSNGFKLRTSATGYASDGGTYIYMAFAESPIGPCCERRHC